MVKSFLRALALVGGAGYIATAGATPVSFTDTVNPRDVFFADGKAAGSYRFVHDIRDDGFDPATDILDSLSITLRFRDDGDRAAESVIVDFDHGERKGFKIRSGSNICLPSRLSRSLAADLIQQDGLLNVVLERRQGDFWFMDSVLAASAERGGGLPSGGGQVPEPATGLLLGLALLVAGSSRPREDC